MSTREEFTALVERLSKEQLAVRLEHAMAALEFFANNGSKWDQASNIPFKVEKIARAAMRDVMAP